MDMLARKVARGKWEQKPYHSPTDVPADVVNCLRTNGNALSFWLCESDRASIDDIVLALATEAQRIDPVHVVVLSRSESERLGIQFESSPGRTPIRSLQDRHVDAVRLSINHLVEIAEFMLERVRSTESCHLYTRRDVVNIVRRAVDTGLVAMDQLEAKIREQISRTGSDSP